MANADTGTTGHYFALKDMHCLRDVKPITSRHEAITVTMPNGDEIQSSFTGKLNYSNLPQNGNKVHVFKSLWGSLLGIGDLCDTGLTAVFTADSVYIVDAENEVVVLSGERDPDTRLWMIALKPITAEQERHAINSATATVIRAQKTRGKADGQTPDQGLMNAASVQQCDTAGDRVEFFSRTFASAAESTLMNAVKKKWIKFPGITSRVLTRHRHRLRTHESAAGHLDQVHQNHRPAIRNTSSDIINPKPVTVVTQVYEERNHMDATGRFPVVSHQGHQYMLIMYSEGSNYIKVVAMKDRTKQSYLHAHREGTAWFEQRGYAPTFQRMDNETSIEFSNYLQSKNIQVDLAPPHMHRRNKAERAIRTWKNHFIATLAGVDPSFPMCVWNELIPQAEITVNLLRPSPTHPRQSAWEGINGAYDFDAHPLAPPGTAVTIHEKPKQRTSWGKHGIQGFYVGPTLQHYRCYSVWVTHLGSTRITDTVAWHPKGYKWECYSPLEMVTATADALSSALHHLATSDTTAVAHKQPIQHIAYDIMSNFQALKAVFDDNTISPPAASALTPAPTTVQRVVEGDTAATPAVQRVVEGDTTATPPVQRVAVTHNNTPTTRHSKRRKHRWLNRPDTTLLVSAGATHDEHRTYAERQALMRAERAAGKKQRRPNQHVPDIGTVSWGASPCTHTINQAIKRACNVIKRSTEWAAWARQDPQHIALDSNGVPFFLHAAHRGLVNTAIDLDDKGKKLSMTTALAGEDGHLWLEKHGEEIIRLFASETIRLIHWHQLPPGKKAAYYNPVVRTKIKDGEFVRRVRGVIGGDQIVYEGDTAAHTASMQLIKLLLNSVVSDTDAKFMTADIKDFYLGTPLPTTEHMRIKLEHIPQHVVDTYDMAKYAHNGAVVVEVLKGIYGLPQAGILAQDRLVKHLATYGYIQAEHTPCLFRHVSNSVSFTLVVDDFGIKYTTAEDADHLLSALRELYIMTEDRAAHQKYVGITIDHDRTRHTISLSMPGYVNKAIARFGKAKKPGAKSPLIYTPPQRGSQQQMVPELPPEALHYVDAATKTLVQEVTGVFLFYSRAVDPTMLSAVNKISTEQSKPTIATMAAVDRLLSYAERYPSATIVIRRSNMQLCVQSDASYLSERDARSRAGGILYFGLNTDGTINGAIDYISCVIPTVCSSVAEAEYAALFLAGREATNARTILTDLGYPQHTTPIICDNACAVGIANATVKQKRSKAIDMRYHWIRDQVQQNKFSIRWEEGATNLADYFTKAHPVHHYVTMRRVYVSTPKPLVIKQCARSRRIARRISAQ